MPSHLNETSFSNSISQTEQNSNTSTQKNQDRDYLSAVERGDIETAHNRYAHVFLEDVQALRDMADIVSQGFESARENEREFGKAQSAERFSKVGETEYTKYNSFIDKKDIKFKIHNRNRKSS